MIDAIHKALRSGRTLYIVHKGKGRVLWPESVTATHLRGWCPHREAHRQFRLADIEAIKVGVKIESIGPSLGPPLEIGMTMQLATRIGAAVVDLVELRNRLDAASPRQQGDLYLKAKAFKQMAQEVVDFVNDALIEQCMEGKEPVIETADGLHRLYATTDKYVKCRDPQGLHAALLEQHGPAVTAQALASGAWKQAACKPLLGDMWPNFFEVIERPKLAEGGAPKLKLTVARNPEEIVDE